MQRIPFLLFFLLISSKCFAQRDTLALNDNWQFKIDKTSVGINEKWFTSPLPMARTVNLPHTWNVEKETENYYGWAWYQNYPDYDRNLTFRYL